MKKITEYLFIDVNKRAIMESMGYYPEDSKYVYNLMSQNAIKKFLDGQYILGVLNTHGQRVDIILELEGKG